MRSCRGSIKGPTHVLGADVAKATVVLFDSASGRTWSVANTPQALLEALTPFADYDLMVCEVTGGFERLLLATALAVGLPAHRADPLRVKRYIGSLGGAAKTDGIDAGWLGRYGQERGEGLVRWQPRDADHDALASLVRHRQHLVATRVEAKNRRSAPGCQPIADFLDEQIAFLDRHIQSLDKAITDRIGEAPELAADEQRLRAVKGFGPVVARTLLALIPELGSLNRRQAASLAGLAPHPRDSGQASGRRRIGPGRDGLRPLLFMAALTAARTHPQLKTFANRLLLAGKPKRLVLTAVARKLVVIANAILRDKHTQPQLT